MNNKKNSKILNPIPNNNNVLKINNSEYSLIELLNSVSLNYNIENSGFKKNVIN
jgi:hypothetical protein